MKNKTVTYFVIQTLIALVLAILTGCKEESFNPALTQQFRLVSTTGVGYEIKVAMPSTVDPSKRYAALYLLDGDDIFDVAAKQCTAIASGNGQDNVFVVSIGYGNSRDLDYTPTKTGPDTGGAHAFLAFMRDQLIPEMEQRYPVDTTRNSRVILGHSYGGLFSAFAFAVDNDVFGNYIILSPSLWYDNEVALMMEKANRPAIQSQSQLVFLGQGEMENSGRMQAPFEAFYQVLATQYTQIYLARHLEKDLGHIGSRNPNIALGLEHYFSHRPY